MSQRFGLYKTFVKENGLLLGVILFLVIVSYGLLAPWLGFYWDDWIFAWLARFYGPGELIAAMRPFRPLLGPVYAATTAILGSSTLGWQLFGLLLRFLMSVALWGCLGQVWPAQKRNVLWVVFIFTVFPGFGQQWVALTRINDHFIPFLSLLLSFGLTVYVARRPARNLPLIVLALGLQAAGLFTTEYFWGLEIVRLPFLLVIFSNLLTDRKSAFRAALLAWLPYLVVWGLSAAWSFAYHYSAAYGSYQINVFSPAKLSAINLANEALNLINLAGFASWGQTLALLTHIDGSLAASVALALMLITTVALFFVMRASRQPEQEEVTPAHTDLWSGQAMLIGLVAMFAGRLPSWAASLPLRLEFDDDRFMLPIMLGASFFIVGLFALLLKSGHRKVFLLSLLVGLSVAHQFSLANSFRLDWQSEREFFWQLAWRIPALEKNTTLLTYQLPLLYTSDVEMTAPLNWIYAPKLSSRQIPYLLLDIKSRLGYLPWPASQPNLPTHFDFRTTYFDGSTSATVVLIKESGGCLRVLDSQYGNRETAPGLNYLLADAIPLSDLTRIQADAPPPVLDQALFGAEPAHDWCYFYEKAELARQNADWATIGRLYTQATRSKLRAGLPVENLPFIEALAQLGKWEPARRLTLQTLAAQRDLCPALLTVWERLPQTNANQIAGEVKNSLQAPGCR